MSVKIITLTFGLAVDPDVWRLGFEYDKPVDHHGPTTVVGLYLGPLSVHLAWEGG